MQELYSAGAARVIIPLPAIQSDEVETYADSVVVSLPTDSAKRDRVWKLFAEELKPPVTILATLLSKNTCCFGGTEFEIALNCTSRSSDAVLKLVQAFASHKTGFSSAAR